MNSINIKEISFKPIWFDSLGAKSSCLFIKTEDIKILIDPGIAIMHPTFPASDSQKLKWFKEGLNAIKSASKNAEMIIISHYHYDHFIDFQKEVYNGKTIFIKNPNEYINDSQRRRAEIFFKHVCEEFLDGIEFEELLKKPNEKTYEDPLKKLPLSQSIKLGDYEIRRRKLLKKGKEWFFKRVKKWNSRMRIPEINTEKVKFKFPEGKKFNFGATRVRFTEPLFHGIEYSRVGWVFATIIERKNEKLIHSSDLNGPIIEDYAEWIIMEDPDILILDGPMTYMLGYTLNLINFKRTLNNVIKIIKESNVKLIIYDHHLPREPKFKERTKEVWDLAKRLNKKIVTAAEFLGKEPVVLTCLKKH